MSDEIAVVRDVVGYKKGADEFVLQSTHELMSRDKLMCCQFCPSRICHVIENKVNNVLAKATEGAVEFTVTVSYADCAACGRIMIADELNTVARMLAAMVSEGIYNFTPKEMVNGMSSDTQK